ncbi:zinc finger BED domain-containing protein [Lachancea lanzarotensis]|uniref:LALA0S06e00452g1_1 n=1 Tax=Lachancea lanzarotensis TaxID=1245769 RepID=A0A0C7N3W2_9SACH|nr:putative transposase of the Rover hAT-like DNA transposon [Lachancea lanzarotensis]CEP62646.1 putative transposase of the Rover hAT-like DNA transposon [Lachancea lanzarotensis]
MFDTRETALFEPIDHDITQQSETTLVETQASGWMRRSSLREHFQVSNYHGGKIATCVHCSKVFKERKSTGNLSKHLKNIHPELFIDSRRRKDKTAEKPKSMALVVQTNHLPNFIAAEAIARPEEFFEIDILIEKQLPISIASSRAWERFIKNKGGALEPRSILERLAIYLRSFDDELIEMMKTVDYVTVVSQIHQVESGETYLTLLAKFILDTRYEDAQDKSELGETHLLDIIRLESEGESAVELRRKMADVFERFQVSSKAILLTRNQEWSTLREECLCDGSTNASNITKDLSPIRCVSELLEKLLATIISHIRATDEGMAKAFDELDKLGNAFENSGSIRQSLAKSGLCSIPAFPMATAMCVWKRAYIVLSNWNHYHDWLKFERPDHNAEMREINRSFQVLDVSISFLSYFVSCCSIFYHLDTMIQTDGFNRLSNAFTFYFTLKRYYDACHSATFGQLVSSGSKSTEFSFINGNEGLPNRIKRKVLNAVQQSVGIFAAYFDSFKENDAYIAAAMLNPAMKLNGFRQFMSEVDTGDYVERGMGIIRCHLKKWEQGGTTTRIPVICNNVSCFSKDTMKVSLQLGSRLTEREVGMTEWYLYISDTEKPENGIDAFQWWISNKKRFPSLFPLATSLLSMKFSHGAEHDFSGLDTLLRGDGNHGEYRRLQILLRDRFLRFGLHQSVDVDEGSSSELNQFSNPYNSEEDSSDDF